MATHSRVLPGKAMVGRAWRATARGLPGVGHDLATKLPPSSTVNRLQTTSLWEEQCSIKMSKIKTF